MSNGQHINDALREGRLRFHLGQGQTGDAMATTRYFLSAIDYEENGQKGVELFEELMPRGIDSCLCIRTELEARNLITFLRMAFLGLAGEGTE